MAKIVPEVSQTNLDNLSFEWNISLDNLSV